MTITQAHIHPYIYYRALAIFTHMNTCVLASEVSSCIASFSGKIFRNWSTEVCLYPNLSEDASHSIHQRYKYCTHWGCDKRCHCIYPQQCEFECWFKNPHVDKWHNAIECGENDGKNNSKDKHEEIADETFDIFVRVVHHFVVHWNSPSTLVLMKAFLEVKL